MICTLNKCGVYAAGQSRMYHILGSSAQVNGRHGYTGSQRRCCRACDEVKQDEYDDGCDDEETDHDDDGNHYDGGGHKYDDKDDDKDKFAASAKTLCMPLDEQSNLKPGDKCFFCGADAKKRVLWGKSY